MENKHRKLLARAFKIISPDLDSSGWTDQEFQQVFINDVNFLLDHMNRRSKQIEELKAKITVTVSENTQSITGFWAANTPNNEGSNVNG